MPTFENVPRPEAAPKNPFKRLAESKIARAGAAALGLHAAALSPQALEVAKRTREAASAFEKAWFQEHTVVHMQTKAEQDAIRMQIKQREARIDPKAVDAYKHAVAQKIERGEQPSFKRLYFDMERLHGVPAAEVADAERIADQRIEAFSQLAGGSLTEAKIKKIVEKMYGADSDYEAGQASVTEYFRTGKRNCDAIDRSEQIVFEGVIAHLPPEERKKYILGERKVKQHWIATLTEERANGSRRMYLLEPGVQMTDATPEAGTADLSADFLKRTTVSNTIEVVHAVGGKVLPSPDLDVVTNQPFPRGFVTVGDLRGSDFVWEEAKREGLKPEVKQATTAGTTEFGLELRDIQAEENNLAQLIATMPEKMRKGADSSVNVGYKRSNANQWSHFSETNFKKIVHAFEGCTEMMVPTPDLLSDELATIMKTRVKNLNFSQVVRFPADLIGGHPTESVSLTDLSAESFYDVEKLLKALNGLGRKIVLPGAEYLQQLLSHPELIDYTNLVPDIAKTDTTVLGSFLAGSTLAGDPKFSKLAKQILNEIDRRQRQGVI